MDPETLALLEESRHQSQYQLLRLNNPDLELPPWEELTEEQQEVVRAENRRYALELHELGERIRRGEV